MTPTSDRARSFDAWATEYDRFRPSYPDELFHLIRRRLGLPGRPLVADLGAGTGRATLAMAALGWRVTAVEPGRPMLDVLRARATAEGLLVAMLQASAEATGLDPGSVDLVTAAQAFHWFDAALAVPEIARILRPGGGVALFWNVRDRERSPFLADYAELLERYTGAADGPRYEQRGRELTRAALGGSTAFEAPELLTLSNDLTMTAAQFDGLVFTASYVRAALDPAAQERLRVDLAALHAGHGHGAEPFTVPYRIDCWIARRRDR